MGWSKPVVAGLHDANIDLVSYLPDSVVWSLIESIEGDPDFETTPVTREEEGVNYLSGAWLGGRRGVLVCQTSGLANTFNALGSLSVPWGLPFVALVSRRGDLGEHNRAQVAAGYNMDELLDDVGVRNTIVRDGDDSRHLVEMAAETAFATETPYVLLLDERFTGGKQE